MRGKLTSFTEVNTNISLLIKPLLYELFVRCPCYKYSKFKMGEGGERWVEMGSRYEVGQENMSYAYEFLYNRT